MDGMGFMLKSFGLDPEVIKKNIGEFGQIIVQIRDTLSRIEQRQIALEARFEMLAQAQEQQSNGTERSDSDDGGSGAIGNAVE